MWVSQTPHQPPLSVEVKIEQVEYLPYGKAKSLYKGVVPVSPEANQICSF